MGSRWVMRRNAPYWEYIITKCLLPVNPPPDEAARRENVTREAARQAAARVIRELRIEGGHPANWESVTVVVPLELAQEIKERARKARRDAGLEL